MPSAPGTTRPTRKDLERLKRWAQVAFAARCARRVQPLSEALWRDAPAKHIIALERATVLAERSAADARVDAVDAADAHAHAHAVFGAAKTVVARYAANAAAYAAAAAAWAADRADNAARAANAVAYAAAGYADADADGPGAAFTADAGRVIDAVDADAAARSDFDLLETAVRDEEWTDDTPVPPEFFGPLWPDGTPEGWPVQEEESGDTELVIEIDVPEGKDSEEELVRQGIQLFNALDKLNAAYGGDGLEFDIEVLEEAPAGRRVPA